MELLGLVKDGKVKNCGRNTGNDLVLEDGDIHEDSDDGPDSDYGADNELDPHSDVDANDEEEDPAVALLGSDAGLLNIDMEVSHSAQAI